MALDILVADLSQNLAGPYCAQVLGDLGAEVIKIERPGHGDPAREWGPPFWAGESPIFLSANRNKRSIAVDLKTRAGAEIARRLAARSDVLLQSFRTGVAERLGLGAETLRAENPRLVYCSVSAFGADGPMRDEPGYDPLMQAYSGLMSVNGHPGQPPSRIGTSIVDIGTGLWAAIGVLAALRERDRTGEGAHVAVSLFDVALAWNAYHLLGYFGTGQPPGPLGTALGMIAPYEAFPTADGQLMIAAANDVLFQRTCRALDLEALEGDERFRQNRGRVAHRAELFDLLAAVTRTLPTAALERRLRKEGVPCAPILSVDRVAALEQVTASGALESLPHPTIPGYRAVASPLFSDGRRPAARRAPPRLGEATDAVLRLLGYEPAEIRALEAEGIIQRAEP